MKRNATFSNENTRFGNKIWFGGTELAKYFLHKTLACDSRSSLILAGFHAGALCGASRPILV